MEHDWYWGVGAYAIATYVGISRVNDHQHFLHDVLAGATIGISYGMGVYYKMSEENRHVVIAKNDLTYSLLPTDDLRGAAFQLSDSF